MTKTYLCATNGIETPSVVAGPFEGTHDDAVNHVQRAAKIYAQDADGDDLLFTLTVYPDNPDSNRLAGSVETDWVGQADMFR